METLELSRAELWFCAPDTPAVDEARVFELKGDDHQVRRFRARLARAFGQSPQRDITGFNFFFQEELPDSWSAVMIGQGRLYLRGDKDDDERKWLDYIHWKYGWGAARLWLPEPKPCCVVQVDSYSGVVFGRHFAGSGRPGVCFGWKSGVSIEQFPCRPQQELEALLSREFENKDSQLRRAYNWQSWDEEERTKHIFRCENGRGEELLFLVRCVLLMDFSHQPQIYYLADWSNVLRGKLHHGEKSLLKEWMRIFIPVFRPFYARDNFLDFEKEHLEKVWKDLLRRPPDEASAHEKLEAPLQLRDWLRTNAPEDEARLMGLFPPLSA